MAWITDPNFGNTMYASEPFAPFIIGGGNRVLSVGAGLTYRDDINQLDISCRCSVVFIGEGVGGAGISVPVLYLIARRQINGDSYLATFSKENFGGTNLQMKIYKYDGGSDTFTLLISSILSSTSPLATSSFDLLQFRFSLQNNSLTAEVLNTSDQVILSASILDSTITTSGSAGIGGTLIQTGSKQIVNTFIDNLQFNNI